MFKFFCIFCFPLFLSAQDVQHYVYFNRDRDRIKTDYYFLQLDSIAGAQLKYAWAELEVSKGKFDFSEIEQDLAFLESKDKKLFIQLQDVSFDTGIVNVPDYLLTKKRFRGGVATQYFFKSNNENHPVVEGWVARRWDKRVRRRFHKLLRKLGQAFDGKIEGINLAETSIEFGNGPLHPEGFSYEAYLKAILHNMKVLKNAFSSSVAMQYANFMPGEFLPWTDNGYLDSLYSYAKEKGIAMGGPDLLPYKKGQMANIYNFMHQDTSLIIGIAVQQGNYRHVHPKTKRRFSIEQLRDFAKDYLGAEYIFWSPQEPFYTRDLAPFLQSNTNNN
ncbi:MAG: hypothetical protein GY810_23920 [Aureispira sp.]|nr:hypothetical protein [Aureispira sp.]